MGIFRQQPLSRETTSQVESKGRGAVGPLKNAYHTATSSLGHLAKGIAKIGAIYGVARVTFGAKDIYEEVTGNTVEYHSPFSKEGFSFEVKKSDRDVVHVREDASDVVENTVTDDVQTELGDNY